MSGAIVTGLPEIVVTCWQLSRAFRCYRQVPDTRLSCGTNWWRIFGFPYTVENYPTNNKSVVYGSLIWIRELRPHVVLTGFVMQLVFEAVMNLQLFGWTMIAGLLLFSDPAMVERLFFWLVIHS